VIPAADVLQANNGSNSRLKPLLKDRIVLIGSSALGLSDRVATPLSASISGMFVHAQAISELLSPREKRFFVHNDVLYMVLQSMLVLGFGLVILQSKRLRWLSLAAGLGAVFWAGLLLNAVHNADPRPVSGLFIGLLVLGLALIPYEWSQARARNRLTAKILARYVSKPVLKDLLAQKSFDPLKPRTAEITVLVADMVGYSEKVATQNLEKAAVITREFLDALTQPVWALRGTLDRYTGDGLVAFWGAPIPEENHAALAVEAAIRMQKNLKLLNERLKAEGLPELSARIGIASGTAQVGDFGTQLRASYTAVGSCINMAARLEATAKTLGVSVLIAEETATALSVRGDASGRGDFDGQHLSPLGKHEIRGIGEQTLYTLTDR
jgi:adenylate cyclase